MADNTKALEYALSWPTRESYKVPDLINVVESYLDLATQLKEATRQRDMLREALAELNEATADLTDKGPHGEEWSSDKLEAARAKTQAALAATQPKESE